MEGGEVTRGGGQGGEEEDSNQDEGTGKGTVPPFVNLSNTPPGANKASWN